MVTIHDVYHLVFGHTLSLLKQCYAKVMIKSATLYSDHVITVSKFSLGEIVKYTGVSPDKISMIHNGVDINFFSYPVKSLAMDQARASYTLPEKYFLFVSTLAPHKNLERLLRAWNRVIQRHSDWYLVLAGKKVKNVEYLKVFDQFPHLASKILFLGQVKDDELPALYQAAHALISPSLYEGFGLPPLEAMAMRCPSVVSQAASLPEVCDDAALYVNPFDEEDIAQKMCTLIENPTLRQTLIEKGKQRINLFNWEKAAQQHIEVIGRLL